MRAREKLFNMTNLAAALDMASKSSLMTLLFVIIIDKQATGTVPFLLDWIDF